MTVDIAAGTATGASVGNDTFTGVVSVTGSGFADTLLGSNTTSTTEQFDARGGNDTIDGRGGNDRAVYNGDATNAGISVNMAAGTVTGDSVIGTDTLLSVEMIRGTNFADTYNASGFSGSSTNAGSNGTFNEFEGMGGNDSITGNGNTRLAFNNASGGVTVNLVAGTASGDSSVGSDTFSGVNAVIGSNSADTIVGDAAANRLQGGGGADAITGGGGADTFTFTATSDSTGAAFDTIADFLHGTDKIDVSAIDANTLTSGSNEAFAFVAAATTSIVANSVTWTESGGDTIVSADVNGDTTADFVFHLTGTGLGLVATDFTL